VEVDSWNHVSLWISVGVYVLEHWKEIVLMTNPKPEPPRTGIVQDCNGKMGNDSFLDAPAPTPEPRPGYKIEFYAGTQFGGWNPSTDAPEIFATREDADKRVAELTKLYPRRGYRVVVAGTPETPSGYRLVTAAKDMSAEALESGAVGELISVKGETPSALSAAEWDAQVNYLEVLHKFPWVYKFADAFAEKQVAHFSKQNLEWANSCEHWRNQAEQWHKEFDKMVDIRDRFVRELEQLREHLEEPK